MRKSLLVTAVLLAAGLTLAVATCGEGTVTQTVTQTTISTVTVTTTTPTSTRTSTSPAPAAGPYPTESAAINYVQAQAEGMTALAPDTTWRPGATLHVIHATPEGGASYGGDFYYFFAGGDAVGSAVFTSASGDAPVDSATYAVTFNVFMSGDPHCCPSGGLSTVKFHWDGSTLVTQGSLQGAEMS